MRRESLATTYIMNGVPASNIDLSNKGSGGLQKVERLLIESRVDVLLSSLLFIEMSEN